MYTVERWSASRDVYSPPSAKRETCAWTILQTKPRHEKALVAELSAAGMFCFLPLVTKVQSYGGRRIEASVPLFPDYVFLHGSAADVADAGRTRRVAKAIHVADQQQIDWELRNLRRALIGPHALEPHPCIKSGMKASVRSGALRGLEGFVEDGGNFNRLILQIGVLGQAVSLEIGASDVHVASER
jgi:hypothetical protein